MTPTQHPLRSVIRLLTFRLSRKEIMDLGKNAFWVGLVGTWIVGMGRYWDDPGAKLLQHLGLGSVIYIFFLAALIWLILVPYKIKDWTYFRVLTFISLTSFPAVFYAIPIEQFVRLSTANTVNAWFLAIVAAWRLALLFYFLRVFTRLSWTYITIVALLPMCLIISLLTALNLHRVVFNIMGGIRVEGTHDKAYGILMTLTMFSVIMVLPLLAGYLTGIYQRRKRVNDTTVQ